MFQAKKSINLDRKSGVDYASDELIREHENVLIGLDVLEAMIRAQQSGHDLPTQDVLDIAHFLREYADRLHHGKEEELLFPAMAERGIPVEDGPVGQMMAEHVKGRQFIAGMKAAAAEELVDTELFLTSAAGYVELLRAHIRKENNVLFPMGDQKIPPIQQAALIREFAAFTEEFPSGHAAALLEYLGHLRSKYLPAAE